MITDIKFGIFFDGTGCNAWNLDHQGNTDEGLYSNIYRLYKYYNSQQDVNTLKIYVEGVGTKNGEEDNLLVEALGVDWLSSKTGIFTKYSNSIADFSYYLEQYLKANPDKCGTSNNPAFINVNFDVFGFSRGAALARHWTNKIHTRDASFVDRVNYYLKEYHVVLKDIKVNFLGLYDTVATIWGISELEFKDPHDSGKTYGLEVNLGSDVADNVFQITASHECRYNFPLSSINKFYPEFQLAGAHSDIGGSYSTLKDENVKVTVLEDNLFHNGTKTVEKDIETIRKNNKWTKLIDPDKNVSIISRYYGLDKQAISKRQVKGELAYVSLIIMAEHAAKVGGCNFGTISQDYESLLSSNNTLYDYYCAAKSAYLKFINGEEYSIDKDIVDAIAQDYIHISADESSYVYGASNEVADSEIAGMNLTELVKFTTSKTAENDFLALSEEDKKLVKQRLNNAFGNHRPNRPEDTWVRKVWNNNQIQGL